MKKIEDEKNLDQKKILLRLDLNIPIHNGIITDSTRIDKILPTLNHLLKYNCKIKQISRGIKEYIKDVSNPEII